MNNDNQYPTLAAAKKAVTKHYNVIMFSHQGNYFFIAGYGLEKHFTNLLCEVVETVTVPEVKVNYKMNKISIRQYIKNN